MVSEASLWTYKSFRRLLYSTVVNDFAQSMALIVVPLLVLKNGGTAEVAGVIVALVTACGITAQFLSGYVSDRSNPTVLIRISSSIQMAAWAILATLQLLDINTSVTICIAGCIAAIFASLSVPAEHTMIQHILPERLYAKANVITQGREAAANLLGNPFAGLIFGMNQIAALIAQSFFHLVSAIAVPATSIARAKPETVANVWNELTSGFALMWRNRPLRSLVLSSSIINLPFGLFPVVMIATYEKSGYSTLLVGVYMSMMGIGIVLGSFFAEKLLNSLSPLIVSTFALLSVIGSFGLTAYIYQNFIFSCLVSLVGGMLLPAINSLISTYTMLTTSQEAIGRVVTASGVPGMILMPLGSLIGGVLLTNYGTSVALVFAAICGIVALAPIWMSAEFRSLNRLDFADDKELCHEQ